MATIDLSTEALQKRREIAENCKGTFNHADEWHIEEGSVLDNKGVMVCTGLYEVDAFHIAANSPDAVIAMIDEIERLRHEIAALRQECRKKIKNHEKDFITLNQEIGAWQSRKRFL